MSNLMLMCYPHHKLIDVDELANYPEQRLLDMKREHEDRIAIVAGILPDRASHVLRLLGGILDFRLRGSQTQARAETAT